MSLPTYHIRPNESNPTILRTLQFLVQANMLMNKNILEDEQKKTLITKVEALVQELNKRYKLDEELNKEKDSLKRFDSLTSAFQQTFEFTENRRVLEELSEEIAETKVEIQKNHSDIRYLNCSVERVKDQIKKETEKHEKRKLSALKVNEELKKKSENIRKNLENSTAVSKLRRLEEEKRLVEKSVEELKNAEAQTLESIKIMKATLKSENKKPFVKLVVEIAKQWRSYNVLLPKLERSRKNVEKLKVEEAARRASGSLDDTIVFDNSFVKATQDNNTTLNINTSLNTSRASIPTSQTKKAPIPQVVPMTTSQSTEQMNTSVRSISSNLSEQQQQQPFLPPRNVESEQVQEQREESMDQSNYEVDERLNSRNTTLEQDPEPRVEEEEQEEPEIENEIEDNIQQEDSQPQSVEEIAEPQNDTINNEEEEAIEENIEEPQEIEEVHNSSVRSNSSKNASGFFDNLLAGKKTSGNGNGKKKDIADTILDISMNSVDGGSDLLKEMENRMEDDRHSQGSQVDNFSFNIFNAAGSTANSESNFDFDFGGGGGGSGGNNDNFDFFGGGDSPSKGAASGEGGAQASSSDPFGFGKASNAENSGFSFNFDDAGSSGAGAGNSSFFNF